MTSTTDHQEPNTILGAGAEADIPEEHRKVLEGRDKPFEAFTQREQIQILHTQVDHLRMSFGMITHSLIEQAGALQMVMGIVHTLKPEWKIEAVPVKGGNKWIVTDRETGKPVEGIFEVKAEESRPVQDPESPAEE